MMRGVASGAPTRRTRRLEALALHSDLHRAELYATDAREVDQVLVELVEDAGSACDPAEKAYRLLPAMASISYSKRKGKRVPSSRAL